jgi:hypothetical protein
MILWKVVLFPAKFPNGSRQSSFFISWENPYRSVLAAVSTKRLISITHLVFSRMAAFLCAKLPIVPEMKPTCGVIIFCERLH